MFPAILVIALFVTGFAIAILGIVKFGKKQVLQFIFLTAGYFMACSAPFIGLYLKGTINPMQVIPSSVPKYHHAPPTTQPATQPTQPASKPTSLPATQPTTLPDVTPPPDIAKAEADIAKHEQQLKALEAEVKEFEQFNASLKSVTDSVKNFHVPGAGAPSSQPTTAPTK